MAVNRKVVGSKPTGTVSECSNEPSLTSFATCLLLASRSRRCVARRKFNHFLLESLGLTKRIRRILQRRAQRGIIGFRRRHCHHDISQLLNRGFLAIQIRIRRTKFEIFRLLKLIHGIQDRLQNCINILLLATSAACLTGLLLRATTSLRQRNLGIQDLGREQIRIESTLNGTCQARGTHLDIFTLFTERTCGVQYGFSGFTQLRIHDRTRGTTSCSGHYLDSGSFRKETSTAFRAGRGSKMNAALSISGNKMRPLKGSPVLI